MHETKEGNRRQMINKIRHSYEHTIYASYLGYITQAIVNNFAPLLFVTFMSEYHLTLDKITLITTINFLIQLCVDLLSAKFADRIGYRKLVVLGHLCSAAGILGLAVFPEMLGNHYVGIMMAVFLYAIGGGVIEVLVSPIVEGCPTKKKEAAMSLLHSFYCWGQMFMVLLSTGFFFCFGIENWKLLATIWAVIPLANAFYFALVPIYKTVEEHEKMSIKGLFRQKVFWVILVLMLCAGASEHGMNQWASAFAEEALGISKTLGDLIGPCAFALCMGTARAIYGKYSEKIPLKAMMSLSAVLCITSYLLAVFATNPLMGFLGCALCGFSVGIFWPGTMSIAAWVLPKGGTAMYALMALAGDLGCSSGPTVVGFVADAFGGNLKQGLMMAIIFPVLILLGMYMVRNKVKQK